MLFKLLDQRSPGYLEHLEAWRHIEAFREGYEALKASRGTYLPQRPGEPLAVWEARTGKPSFTPVMSEAVRDLAARLRKSPYRVEGLPEDPRWETWEDQVDGMEMDISRFIYSSFIEFLYHGRVAVGTSNGPGEQPVSLLDSERSVVPRCVFFKPWEVILWGDQGYVTKQIIQRQQPLEKPENILRYTVWLPDRTEVYEAPARMASDGRVVSLLTAGSWVRASSADVPQVSSVPHEGGKPLLVFRELPAELWVGSKVYPKQWQHYLIENAWTDAGSYAGTIQRVFTPPAPVQQDDPRYTVEQPDYSQVKQSNANILIGAGFKFEESSGAALGNLQSQLDLIAYQIKSLVGMTFAAAQETVAQSGVAKEIDQSLLNDSLGTYGEVMKDFLEAVYGRVATLMGESPDTVETITVLGFNHYRTDTLETLLEKTDQILSSARFLSPTALRLWLLELQRAMLPNLGPNEVEAIEAETENIPLEIDAQATRTDPDPGDPPEA